MVYIIVNRDDGVLRSSPQSRLILLLVVPLLYLHLSGVRGEGLKPSGRGLSAGGGVSIIWDRQKSTGSDDSSTALTARLCFHGDQRESVSDGTPGVLNIARACVGRRRACQR